MSEWVKLPFNNIFLIPLKNGLNKPTRVRGSGLPMVNMKEIFAYDVIDDETPMELVPVSESERNSLLAFDDLLFARQSLVESGAGKISIFKGRKETVFEGHLIRCRIDTNLADPNFVYYLFKSPIGKGTVSTIVEQTAAAGIRGSDLAILEFEFPPLLEQKAIASILSALDDKIDLLNRQNQTLEALAQTLFRQWFVEEAEEGWEEGVLTDEFELTMGLSPPGTSYNEDENGIPMFQGNADFGFRFPSNRVFTTDPRRFAEKFDTLISVRAPVGEQNMALEKCCIGRGVAALRHKKHPSFYTYTYFKLHSLMNEIRQFNDEGTVFGSIGKGDFMAFKITLPPLNIVYHFQSSVKPIDDKVIVNCNQIRTLEKLRDMLLPKLMSGEVRVMV